MKKKLSEYLRDGEKVLWEGKPETFPLLDQALKYTLLIRWIVTVAVTIAVLFLYMARNAKYSMGFIALLMLVALVVIAAPVMERRNLLAQKYWLTNQRAIMMNKDKTFYYLELDQIDDYQTIGDQAEFDCLALGSSVVGDTAKQLRWRACHPQIDLQGQSAQDNVIGMIFYCVSNADGAVAVLKSHRAKAA